MRTVHVIPVGLSLWDNIGPDSAEHYAGGDQLQRFLETRFDPHDDEKEVDFDPVATLTRTYPLFRGDRPDEALTELAADFDRLSAETTSLAGETTAVPARLGPRDHVLLIASHTRRGLRAAVGVAHAIDIAARHHRWPALADQGWQVVTAQAGTDSGRAVPALLDRLTLPGGTLLVLDHLDMLSTDSYQKAREALGRVAAVWTVLMATEHQARLRLHLNGGFKALMPPLLSAGGLVAALADTRYGRRVDTVLVPRGEGFALAQDSMTTSLDPAIGLADFKEALRGTDADSVRRNIDALSKPLPPELTGLCGALLTDEYRRHTTLGGVLLTVPSSPLPTAHCTGR